jgi:hypothetical protein
VKVDVELKASPFMREGDKPDPIENTMEDMVYEHLVDLVDFDRMYQLEQLIELRIEQLAEAGLLPEREPEQYALRAAEIMARAWHRLIEDPRRYVDFRGEWQPEDDCELCQALEDMKRKKNPPTPKS